MPTQTYFELLEMMEAEAAKTRRAEHVCPVCRLTLKAVDGLLHLLSLENVNDVDTRLELRAAGGFCNRHAFQWAGLHDALGTAIIYEDLLREAGRRVERGDLISRRSGLFGRSSPPPNPFTSCPLCNQQKEIETRIAADFAEGFAGQARFRQAYSAPAVAGLCLEHYRQSAEQLEGQWLTELATQQQAKFAATQALLRIIIEKMDAAVKMENISPEEKASLRQIGHEREALTRAIWQMAGLEHIR